MVLGGFSQGWPRRCLGRWILIKRWMPSGQNGGLQEMPVFSIVSPRVRGVGSERYSPVHRTSADIHLCLGTWDFGQCVSSSNGMNMHRRCSDTRIGATYPGCGLGHGYTWHPMSNPYPFEVHVWLISVLKTGRSPSYSFPQAKRPTSVICTYIVVL